MKYNELNNQVIDELRKIGVWYAYDSRLALFWLRNNIPRLFQGTDELIPKIDELVRMRVSGNEPKHKDGSYL